MLTTIAVVFALAQDSGRAFRGADRALAVPLPRVDTAVTIDGVLEERVWAGASRLTGFSQYQPVDSRPAEEETDVFLWYSPTALYIGIRAHEAHGDVVRATRADRDNIGADDHVQILLDTYDDRRRAYLFGVNPFGVQQDGIRSDQFGGGAGGFSGGGRMFTGSILDGNADLNPDFVWESRGRLVPGGYEIEIRIPFKSLRYQGGNQQHWGINVLRRVQHTGYQDSWAPVVRASASFLGQSGRIEGLHDLRRGLVMELAPFGTGRLSGAPDAAGQFRRTDAEEFGLNARWGITQNLGLDGTINPDFSQVETDVGQVTINERFALFFPEKRPFFLEGLELFDTPNQLIYTRQIVNPGFGVKLAGKVGGTNIAFLTAADDAGLSATGDTPLFGALRLRRDLGRNSTAGLVATTREDGAAYSRLLGADVRILHSRLYFVELQAVNAWTRTGTGTMQGPLYQATWDRTGRAWGFNYRISAVDPDFRAAVGFVNRSGVVNASAFNRLTAYGRRGALVETVGAFIGVQRTYQYTSFGSRDALEGGESVSPSATLRGGWAVSGSLARSFYSFDPALYSAYTVQRLTGAVTDTVAFAVPGGLPNLFGGSLQVTTPTFRHFTASAGTSRGRAAIFPEAAEGRTFAVNGSVDWRPTGKLRISGQWVHRIISRDRDGSPFSTEDIPRLKAEFQASRAVFVRFVGQYTARRRAALEDAQGRSLLQNGALTTEQRTNDLRVDWLFSYRPSPGTLVFLGYGASLSEPDAFAFGRDLERLQDGFFTKVSWLFRL